MNTRIILIFVFVGFVASAGVTAFLSLSGGDDNNDNDGNITNNDDASFDALLLDFDYDINADIASGLSDHDIQMSSPIKIFKPSGIEKYCKFFDDVQRQSHVEYCTSTELLDQNGDFLGNIHMIGTLESPKLVIVVLQISSSSLSNDTKNITTVFDTVIDTTVCDCWEQESPNGFADISSWVEALNEFHAEGAHSGITTKSGIVSLYDKKIQMELTDTEDEDSKLWNLFVTR